MMVSQATMGARTMALTIEIIVMVFRSADVRVFRSIHRMMKNRGVAKMAMTTMMDGRSRPTMSAGMNGSIGVNKFSGFAGFGGRDFRAASQFP